ncbi:MAG: hypothetical protein WC192_00580 [Candidatus Babeliales bacterium]
MIELIKKEKNFLLLTFFLSLAIKVIFFLIFLKNNSCLLMFDSGQYHKVALNILSWTGQTNFYRMPGYPVFLAACYKIFGVHPIAALIMQIILGSLIPLLVFALALVLFDKSTFNSQIKTAKLASLVACFDLGYIIFPGLIMSEILFTMFFTLFLILFLYNYTPFFCKSPLLKTLRQPLRQAPSLRSELASAGRQGERDEHTKEPARGELVEPFQRVLTFPISRLFLAGIALGIACLIRPVGHGLFLTSIFMLMVSKDKFFVKIKSIALFSTGLAFTLGIWIFRNFLLTGYIFMHTLSGPHFLNHSAVRLCMMDEKITYEQAQKKVYAELKNLEPAKTNVLGKPLQEIEHCQLAEKLAISYMLKNPVLTVQHFISNMLKTTFGLYSSELLVIDSGGQLPEYSNNRSIKSIFKRFLLPDVNNKFIIWVIYFEIIFFLFILLGLAIFIFISPIDRGKICTLIKTLPFICCLIFLTLSCGYARLRLPIESFLIILAIKEWQLLFSKKGE